MLKNYIKVAIRSLRKQRVYAFVNVFGLAVGMASCLLIFMLVWHELSFDRFHANAEPIYRTYLEYRSPDGEPGVQAMMTPSFTESLLETFPAIDMATPFVAANQDLQVDEQYFRQRLAEVESDFFRMFSFPLLAGSVESSLDDPSSMVLTEETASSMFGLDSGRLQDAVGKTVSITRENVQYDFTVSAIAANFPENSSIDFDAAISFENYDPLRLGGNNWGGRTSTYVLLADGTSRENMEAALVPWAATEFASYIESMRGASNMAEGDGSYALRLQPLGDLHTSPDIWVPYEAALHDPIYSIILSSIGLLILLIACINFMTLSVGQSATRAREVGMRKVLGAYRSQLMKQYWGESFVLTAFSLVLGLILATVALPFFNDVTGKALSISTLAPSLIFLVIVGLIITVGLFAGGYPAIVLSRFQPASVLKGDAESLRSGWLTRTLIVLQYTISIGLIACTGIMSEQLNYMFNKDLGYEKELVVTVNAGQVAREDADRVLDFFRDRLLPYDGITHISRSGSPFTRGSDRNTWQDGEGITRSAYNFGVGYDYIDLMGMEIVDGRNFSRDFPSDPTSSILVNEALVDEFGIEEPIGAKLNGWLDWMIPDAPTIIGVVKNYHFQSLREEVAPAVMNMHPEYYNYLSGILIKTQGGDIAGKLDLIEKTWSEILPAIPFTHSFLDEDVANQYQTEQRWQKIVTSSSILAILIACLGLFGLAILTVTRRTREIGIRKVLGASIPGVASLVAREFAILVFVASIIAAPVSYFVMKAWLTDFAVRIEITPFVFVLSGLLAVSVALATVGFQAFRAARLNPVETLRHE